MGLKQVFFKDSVIYGLSSYLSLIAAFILTPIYTRIFSKEDYGIMDLFSTWNNFFILIIPLGLSTAILRMYHDFSDDLEKMKKHLGTLLMSLLFSCTIYVFVLLVFPDWVLGNYYKSSLNTDIYYLSIGIIVFTVFTTYFQAINRIQFNRFTFLTINLLVFLLISILGFVLVVLFGFGINGFFIASFIATGIGFVLSIILGRKNIYFSFDFAILQDSLKYSLPLLMVVILIKLTFIVDRIIINNLLDLKSIGDYSIIMRIGNVFQLFVGAFTTAWFPYAMSIIKNKDRNDIYGRGFEYYLLIFSILAFCIMLFNKEVILFFAPSYLNIESIVYIVIPTGLIGGTSYFLGLGLHINKKTIYFIYSALISFLVNVTVSIFLAKHFGLIGIAIGSLFAILAWVLAEYYFSFKFVKLKFRIFFLFMTFVALLLFGGLMKMFNFYVADLFTAIVIKLIIVILLFGLAFINVKFRKMIIGSLKKYLIKQ